MAQSKGFTLIELLVVIAIIGLLSTLAVVSLNNARQKSRDAKRVSDIKQVQTALELFYADNNGYPVEAAANLGDANNKCLDEDGVPTLGFVAACDGGGTTYMGQVPKNPSPVLTGSAEYVYKSLDGAGAACAAAPCASYSITFGLEGAVGDLAGAAVHVGTPNGIQ